MANNSKKSGNTYEKNYIGKGKKHETLDITKVTIEMEKAEPFIYEYDGRKFLSFEVAVLQNPDDYGKTHTVYVSEKIRKNSRKGE